MYAVCLRERGGIGDVICTLPAVKRLKEDGYNIIYVTENAMVQWVELCPFVDKVVTLPAAEMWICHNPLRPPDYMAMIAAVAGIEEEEIDKVVNFFCPAVVIERACADYGFVTPLNRVEIFWCAAGYKIEELPTFPMEGLLEVDEQTEAITPYCVIQAHSSSPSFRPMPPMDIVTEKLAEDKAHMSWEGVVVIGTSTELIKSYETLPYEVDVVSTVYSGYLVSIIEGAEILYGPDSSCMHIAACVGTPSFTWHTHTSKDTTLRRYPLAEGRQSKCLPCYFSDMRMQYLNKKCDETACCQAEWR